MFDISQSNAQATPAGGFPGSLLLLLAAWLLVAGALLTPSSGAALQAVSGEGQQVRVLEGVVLEAGTDRPLSRVEIVAGGRHAVTDADGRYRFVLPPGITSVTVQRIGYAPVTLRVEQVGPVLHLDSRPVLLSAISVEGEGRAVLARGTALAVETVEHHELHGHGHTSLAPALSRAEGVSVAWTGSWGGRALLRGMGGERLAILVDGNRMNRACVFGMDQGLATIDPAQVERVEILSGPGSTLYGSGNVGGVINVVTRQNEAAEGRWGEVRAGLGSAARGGTMGASAGLREGRFDLGTSLDGATWGDYRTPVARVDGSSFRTLSADLKAGFQAAPGHRLNAAAQLYEGRDIGWPISAADASIPSEGRRNGSLDWAWQRGGLVDAVSARGYIQRVDHHMLMSMQMMMPGGGMGGGGMAMTSTTDAASHSTTSGGRLQLRLLPGERTFVDAGVEATHLGAEATRWTERRAPDGMMSPPDIVLRSWPGVRILDVGAFAQGELQVTERVILSAGLRGDRVVRRADDHDTTREAVASGNAGLRVVLNDFWAFRGTVGRGFRLPDATELFGAALRPDGFIYRGDPDVRTETSRSVEGSIAYGRPGVDASVTLFRNELSDLITPAPSPGETIAGRPVRTYANVAAARFTGMSFAASWAPSEAVTLSGQGNWTEGEDREDGEALPGVPPLEGGVALRLSPVSASRNEVLRSLWLEVAGQGAARQRRNAIDLGEPETPAWAVLNLRGGAPVAGTQLVLGVENLLDQAYRGHVDPSYTLLRPGRNLHLSVVRRF